MRTKIRTTGSDIKQREVEDEDDDRVSVVYILTYCPSILAAT
jgi:hypothetical protein